jgi:hypothetical protein
MPPRANKTDAGNGSYGICRVIDASRSPSPDPKRYATNTQYDYILLEHSNCQCADYRLAYWAIFSSEPTWCHARRPKKGHHAQLDTCLHLVAVCSLVHRWSQSMGAVDCHHIALLLNDRIIKESQPEPKRLTKRMQATARMVSVVSSTLPARRRLIRNVRPKIPISPNGETSMDHN